MSSVVTSPMLKLSGFRRKVLTGPYIMICVNTLQKLWDVPLSAKKLWIKVGFSPRKESVELRLLLEGSQMRWKHRHKRWQYFGDSYGFRLMAKKLGIRKGLPATVHVQLLYEEPDAEEKIRTGS